MGWRERWRFIRRAALAPNPAPVERFSAAIAPVGIDEYLRAQVAGLGSLGPVPSRELALQVPAVLRGRNLICSIATLPLVQTDAQHVKAAHSLLTQIDPNVPNLVTVAQTLEDLLMDGLSWWRILQRGHDDFPTSAQHLDVHSVSLDPPAGWRDQHLPSGIDPESVVWVDGAPVNGRELIRFDSPNPGILQAARRAIRRAAKLDMAAERYADDPRALEYFTPAEGADPAGDDDIRELLDAWAEARRDRAAAYVPAALEHHTVDWMSPADLQLVGLQQRCALDIANAIGLDPEDLGISTTSRTYQNATDRRRDRINDVLSVYMQAITGRLSMNDVTKRGYKVGFDLADYLRADPMTMAQVQEKRLAAGTQAPSEARTEWGSPPLTAAQKREISDAKPKPAEPAAGEGDSQGGNVRNNNVLPIRAAFAGGPGGNAPGLGEVRLSFAHTDAAIEQFTVDQERRTIRGLAVPYNVWASNGWAKWKFLPGSLSWSSPQRVKFLQDHWPSQTLGVATELTDTDAGLMAAFRVGKGEKRDEALADAADGILDGLSIGPMIHEFEWDKQEEGYVVSKATLREISLCAVPAFDEARLTSVAASANGGSTMHCPLCGGDHAAGTPCSSPAAASMTATTPAPAPVPAQAPAPAPAAGFDPAAFAAQMRGEMAAVLREAFAGMQAPAVPAQASAPGVEVPAVVNPRQPGSGPTATAQLSVREPLPYRFASDRHGKQHFLPGDHLFSADLLAMSRANDTDGSQTDAGRRVMALLKQTFDVDTGDVNELNPTINQPSKYVDQQDYRTPLWDFVNDGGLPNGVQPFGFPKFSSASGLVGDHSEGTEPTSGTFVTTSQTITPTAVSGKASLTREIWDMGGNPQASTLIWRQMVRSWWEALEQATATFLATLTAATDITLTAGGVDATLASDWDMAVAELQFTRSYDFRAFAMEKVLFKAFADARGTDDRPLFPMIGAQNANGTAASRFRRLDLSGVEGVPSWALSSTPGSANNSWLFDPMFVHGWATAPTRLEFPGTDSSGAYAPVAMVDIGLFGYKAFANSDIAAVRQVIYDSTSV